MAIEDFDQVTIAPAKLRPFSKFIMSIGELPTSYLDSLSYAEQVTWFCDYLQNNVIPALNNNAQALQEVQNLMTELQEYVDNYFTNLDVQEEINNKLDQMATDGTLYNIIRTYTDPIIDDMQRQINSLASGSPLVATSTDEMTNTSKIYVNTTNGYWYYYNGTQWIQGGIYQASVNNNDVNYLLTINDEVKDYNGDYILTESGTFNGQDITINGTANNRARSKVFDIIGNYDIEILNKNYYFSVFQQDNLGNVTNITSNFGNNVFIDGSRTTYTQKFTFYNTESTNKYRILIRNLDDSTFTDTPVIKFTKTNDYNIEDINNNIVRNLKVYHGSFGNDDIKRNVYQSAMNRLKTGIIKPTKKLHVEITNNDFYFLLFKQTGETVTSTSNHTNADLEVLDNTIYRILIRKTDNTEILENEITDNLLICYDYDSYYNQLKTAINNIDPVSDNYKQLMISNANNVLRQSYINQFAFNDLDNGYISIGFDDGNADCAAAIEYCHSVGVPCYLALIPARSEIEEVNDMTVDLLSYGGELCSHNGTVITPAVQANEETMFSLFFNTKYYLENKYNTIIHGIIQAGGTGQNTEDKSLDDKWSRCAGYEYSDYYGNTTPYNLGRRNLTRFTHEEQTTLINQAKQNHEWQIWFCHHVNGQEQNSYPNGYQMSDFRYFVDECLRIGVSIVIPYYVISNFGTTELEKRVSALEN